MTLCRMMTHSVRAGLFRAGPFMDTTALRWVRGFEIGATEWNSRSHLA
jgi:hypothetical protein